MHIYNEIHRHICLFFFGKLLFPKSIYRQIQHIHGNMVCSLPSKIFVVCIKRIIGVLDFPIAHVLKIESNCIVRDFHNTQYGWDA